MSVLFVAALEEETLAFAGHTEVLHLGVGKVQAAATLAARLAADPCDLVVSIGTAGGLQGQPIGAVVEIATVLQHDFDHAGVSAFVGRELPGGPLALDGPPGASERHGQHVQVADQRITAKPETEHSAGVRKQPSW